MFKFQIRCNTHTSAVISAESNPAADAAPFVFFKDGAYWKLDDGNLYCTGGEGEHEFSGTIVDDDGNFLAYM